MQSLPWELIEMIDKFIYLQANKLRFSLVCKLTYYTIPKDLFVHIKAFRPSLDEIKSIRYYCVEESTPSGEVSYYCNTVNKMRKFIRPVYRFSCSIRTNKVVTICIC